MTEHVAAWMDHDQARTVWILGCLQPHNAGDWGELDPHDPAANDHALAQCDGRVLSSDPVPGELPDRADSYGTLWVITDDLTDPLTTILWPSDY